ncbi:MAG: pyruvate kinase [Bacilli bacterium]
MNKTKIIATIGPASESKEILKKLIEQGIDVVRVNLKHASYDFCRNLKLNIDSLNTEMKKNIAIMFDLRGPEIRTGKFMTGKANLIEKTKIRIYMDEILGDSTKFSVNYKKLLKEVNFDTIIKINDGKIVLQVIDKGADYLLCLVISGGEISDNKNVNAVGIRLNRPFVSDQDRQDIKFACELGIDFLALSFVETSENILEINDILINNGNDHIGIIAKIENERAYEDIDDIIEYSEGIMVARGDLGVQLPIERVPGIQKAIINKCHKMGKVSIVATEMMSSMEKSITPTRAEVSDVANAVLDGTDAVMLSGETTIGKFPVETVETMSKILTSAEIDIDYNDFMDRAIRSEENNVAGMIAHNVSISASHLNCKAIFAPTMSGFTAKKISRYRPVCPIIAASPNIETVKSLQLYFGVLPILIDELKTFDKIIEISKKKTSEEVQMEEKDKYIITGGYPFKEIKYTNFMKIEEI